MEKLAGMKELILPRLSRKASLFQQQLVLKKRKKRLAQMTRRIFLMRCRSSKKRMLGWHRS